MCVFLIQQLRRECSSAGEPLSSYARRIRLSLRVITGHELSGEALWAPQQRAYHSAGDCSHRVECEARDVDSFLQICKCIAHYVVPIRCRPRIALGEP